MSLSNYARAAYQIGEEFREMLHDEEYEPLLAELSAKSRLDLNAFQRTQIAMVEKIATAQPAKRKKMLEKLPLETRFWTIASAAQMAYESASVLEAVDLELRPGGPYREMIYSVQTVLNAPFQSRDYTWPFPTNPPEGVFD